VLRACLLLASLVGSAAANAGPRAIHLVYNRGAGAEQCPSQAELQQGIIARLGRDPFWGRGARQIWITISRSGTELVATIAAQAEDGGAAQVRAVTSRRAECVELASAVELAIAIAIDPGAAIGRPSEGPGDVAEPFEPPSASPSSVSAPSRAPETAALVTAQHAATPEARSARDRHWFVGAGLLLTAGAGPSPSAGFALGVGARQRDWSLTVEGRVDYPTEQAVKGGGAVGAAPILGEVVPCFHVRWLAACAVAAAGILRGSARGLPNPRADLTPYCAAGARLAAELPVNARFALGAHFDLLATLTPTHLQVDQMEAWSTPVASGTLGLSAIERFW
jgi:hypothetical protein